MNANDSLNATNDTFEFSHRNLATDADSAGNKKSSSSTVADKSKQSTGSKNDDKSVAKSSSGSKDQS